MTLTPGTKLDGYDILRPLGAGGMGEVYRARDPVLKREVAIKILPSYFSQDPDRLRRFEQEAQAAAALNHPNILAVHRFGTFEGAPYLVSELLDGGTLGQLLTRGPLPVRKAIDYGTQIASGLAAAHEKGIVHRDLKPDNIFVTKDGRVKILDFGLAKLTGPKSAPAEGDTVSLQDGTAPGVVLGTVGYMSPEQVRGETVDYRADIFAFGVILYEMLTGKRAFRKPTSTETMTAILNEDPPAISQSVTGTPPALLRIVHRCLEKSPEQRFQSASDLAFALEALSEPQTPSNTGQRNAENNHSAHKPGGPDDGDKPSPPLWKRKATIVAAACVGIAAMLYPWIAPQIERLWRLRELQQLTAVPLTALSGNVASPSFSPDGSQIAFAWDGETNGAGYDLYVKAVGSEKPLRLTHHPSDKLSVAWSPDGRNLAQARVAGEDSGIYLISPTGGPERKLASRSVSSYYGNEISWSPDGKVLAFIDHPANAASSETLQLFLLSLDTLERTKVQTNCNIVATPSFSPRGTFLAWVCDDTSWKSSLWLLRLKDGVQTQLLSRADQILGLAWSSDERRIAFSVDSNYGALWETSVVPHGRTEILPIGHDSSDLATRTSRPGLAYVQGPSNTNIWRLDLFASPPQARKLVTSSRDQSAPSISPDGSKIAFESTRTGVREIWMCDSDGSNAQQLTDFRHPSTGTPRWSPDGKLIAFDSRVEGEANLYVVDPHSGVPHKLNINVHDNSLPSWSHDGVWIYFVSGSDSGKPTVWKAPSTGGHAVQIAGPGAIIPLESPDGQYVYFARDSKLWRVRTDGSTEETVAGMPEFNFLGDEWFPAEAGIYFLSHPNGKSIINLFDPQTRQVRPIYTLEKSSPGWVGGMPVSKDGKFMLFPQVDEASSDLMLIENWR
jgi:serine/threonine protein kinase/Tol biopolymer transport system component